jgi:hypothetical protein
MTMTAALNKIALFRWRAATYFFAAGFGALGGALATSNGATTAKEWMLAGALALAAGFTALKGFLDSAAQTATTKTNPETPEG